MFIAVYLNKLPIRRFYKIVMFIVIYNVFFAQKITFCPVSWEKEGGGCIFTISN